MTLAIWLLSFFLAAAPATAIPDPIVVAPAIPISSLVGFWLMEDQDVVVEISREGAVYVGRFVAARKNPNDPKKKALLNTYLLKNLKPDGDELTGQLRDPGTGKEYKASLVLTGPKLLELRVKAMGIVAHKETWTHQSSAK